MQMKTEPCSGTGVVADDGKNLTPGMRQYREIKAQYPDAILFFHIGDFFETLEGDAEIVSRELDLVLTSRSKNGDRRIPLAGVPHHAVKATSRGWWQRATRSRSANRPKTRRRQKGS